MRGKLTAILLAHALVTDLIAPKALFCTLLNDSRLQGCLPWGSASGAVPPDSNFLFPYSTRHNHSSKPNSFENFPDRSPSSNNILLYLDDDYESCKHRRLRFYLQYTPTNNLPIPILLHNGCNCNTKPSLFGGIQVCQEEEGKARCC